MKLQVLSFNILFDVLRFCVQQAAIGFSVIGLGLVLSLTEKVWAFESLEYRIDSRFRYGVRTHQPYGLATLQQQHDLLSTVGLSEYWTAQMGARLRYDGAYSLNRSRYEGLEQYDPPELELREFNLEYRNSAWLIRAGQQLIVWGEAFGTFYADLINPKELRESGLGDLIDLRRPSELLNVQYIQQSWSAQAIYQPFYRVSRIPRPESDFFPKAGREALLSSGLKVDFRNENNPEDKNGDFGFRFQTQINATDFSIFYFNHIDRLPVLSGQLRLPNTIEIRGRSFRTQALGLTSTWAGESIVLRTELVTYLDRAFGREDLTAEANVPIRSQQNLVVLGLDYPLSGRMKGWQIGTQFVYDAITDSKGAQRRPEENVLGILLQRTGSESFNSRVFSALSMTDGSSLIQAGGFWPVNDQVEVGLDVWNFSGEANSQFGSLAAASRFLFVIRGVFSG